MHTLNAKRLITSHLESSIGLNGVREEDEFILDIFQERKRALKLNRTLYKIQIAKIFSIDYVKAKIELPCFGEVEGRFTLELIASQTSKYHDEKSRYLFKSLDGHPFRLNGIQCFEAFVERGDVIEIGFNRLHFPKKAIEFKDKSISEKLVQSHISVLIQGETGTGKTTLAKKIHEESGRAGKFVHLNLSAFSTSIIESELFGHVKGAFTGALNSKKGAILEAHKGTLFLDEVDSLSLDLQTKLLLFLDNYEVRAVGGESSIKSDVRVIFASGTKLSKRVQDGLMRKDFYFRLQAGVMIDLENLRSEPKLITEICQSFEAKEAVVITKDLLDYYLTCPWPGNIRQLQSHLQKKKLFSNGRKLVFDDLDKELIENKNLQTRTEIVFPLEKVKLDYCYDSYLQMDKNIARTAKVLELCPNTLKAYLRKKEEELRNHNVIQVNF